MKLPLLLLSLALVGCKGKGTVDIVEITSKDIENLRLHSSTSTILIPTVAHSNTYRLEHDKKLFAVISGSLKYSQGFDAGLSCDLGDNTNMHFSARGETIEEALKKAYAMYDKSQSRGIK